MLWWKLLLTPVMIGALTLIGRRWGPRAAGLIVGLPLTTGPVSVFLAREQGTAFAARAAIGSVVGFMNACCCVAVFALTLRRRSVFASVASAIAVVAISSVTFGELDLSMPVAFGISAIAIVVLWRVVRQPSLGAVDGGRAVPRGQGPTSAWDLPARMLIATAMVAGTTAAATLLGSRMSGVLSALPILGGLLAIFTQQREGRDAAVSLVAAMIIGSLPGILFFAVVHALVQRAPLATAYGTATLIAMLLGLLISTVTRPRRPAALPEAPATLHKAA